MDYSVAGDELIIREQGAKVVWRGKPDGYPVRWAAVLPGRDDGVVLYTYYLPTKPFGAFQNLVRVRPDGTVAWRAELPDRDDTYTNAQLAEGKLTAWSWGGFKAQIDVDTGRILEQVFTK